jgi:hypothetical protein
MSPSLHDEVTYLDGASRAHSAFGVDRQPRTRDPSPFAAFWTETLNGQRLIEDEAERGVLSWVSPTELARLLLMRRDPKTGHSAAINNLRLLGVVTPEIELSSQIAGSPFLPRQDQSCRFGYARRYSWESRP